MKRLLFLLFAAVMIGCGDEFDPNSIIGRWDRYESKVKTDYFSGVVYTYVEHTQYKFQKDGTCSMYKKALDDEILKSGTYEYNEDAKRLSIRYEDNTLVIFKAELVSGKLSLTTSDGTKIILDK